MNMYIQFPASLLKTATDLGHALLFTSCSDCFALCMLWH